MADLVTGLNSSSYAYGTNTQSVTHTTDDKASKALDMADFLQLMVATFQNQSIDNTADISDMMNQMVQMSVVQTVTNLNTLITNTMNQSYAASLLGKEVTIIQQNGRTTTNITGTVTGTGNYNGEQVVYIGDKRYALSDIAGVGKIPDTDAAETSTAKAVDNARNIQDNSEIADADEANQNAYNYYNNTLNPSDDLDGADSVNQNNASNVSGDNGQNVNDDSGAEAAQIGGQAVAAENQAEESIADAGEPDAGNNNNSFRVTDYDPATGAMIG